MATLMGMTALLLWSSLALLAAQTSQLFPFLQLAICFFIGFVLSLIWQYKRYGTWFSKPKLRRSQWLVGIYGLFGYHFCYFFALRFAPVLEVSLINYLWPLLLSLFIARSGNRLFALMGGLIAFSGIFILLSNEQTTFTKQYVLGYLLAFSAAIIWASYSALLTKQKSDLKNIGWLSLAVSLLSFICHLIFEPISLAINLTQWLYLLLIGVGPLGGAFYLWEYGLAKGNHRLLASISFLTPVMSSVLLALFAKAQWSLDMLIALLMILLGGIVTHTQSYWSYFCDKNKTQKSV